jgi:hypothetical protein
MGPIVIIASFKRKLQRYMTFYNLSEELKEEEYFQQCRSSRNNGTVILLQSRLSSLPESGVTEIISS